MTLTALDNTESLRVIILPTSSSDTDTYDIIQLPNPRTLQPTKFLINKSTNQILELKLFNYQNPHIPKNVVTTRDGKVVKSIILNDESDGLVLENLEFLIATEFNFIYLLISFYERTIESLNNDKNYKLRLYNLEDLLEVFENDKLIFGDLPRSFFEVDNNKSLLSSIDGIFDKFEENDEIYYKLDPIKILSYLQKKLDAIIENFPKSMLRKLILEKLTPVPTSGSVSGEQVTLSEEVIKSAKIFHSINIISSYISPLLSFKLSKIYTEELEILRKHKNYLASLEQGHKLAQDNLTLLNENLKVEKRKLSSTTLTRTTTKKKVVKKVEVGKGALDGFFKKK